ncbi:isochorismatase family protein [Pseudomonas chlororaphis]|uniref:isochorismatase family protein n=1 Tax=Pseudomonas chlororaphis TaxID=587753 RepID=UPI0024088ED2|nr:isochorismatase family protein [Pseudomonas chlororaphis]
MKGRFRVSVLSIAMSVAALPLLGLQSAFADVSPPNQVQSSYQKLLNRNNSVLLLVDHQLGLLSSVRDMDIATVKHNVVALAKAAQIMGVPVVITSTYSKGGFGPIISELTSELKNVHVIDRNSVNAWDDPQVRRAIEATGRKNLIIAGVSLEVCAAFPALTAKADGYNTYVVLDASGTFNKEKHEAGLARLIQAGVIPTDYATVGVEWLRDNSDPKAGALYGALDMPGISLINQLFQVKK